MALHTHDPRHIVSIMPLHGRLRVRFAGETVALSTCAQIVSETGLPDRYYVPAQDVTIALQGTSRRSTCPYKGGARYWTLRVRAHAAEDAAWSYDRPTPLAEPIRDHICFYDHIVRLEIEPA